MYVEGAHRPGHGRTRCPRPTIDAFRDHGVVARTVDATSTANGGPSPSSSRSESRCAYVTDKLLVDGLASFQKSFDGLLARLEQKAVAVRAQDIEVVEDVQVVEEWVA